MLKQDCRKGMKVIFGRQMGEKTIGEVVKINPKKAKVKILEQRGAGRGSAPGSIWLVTYDALEPYNGDTSDLEAATQAKASYGKTNADDPVAYHGIFGDGVESHIMLAINGVYNNLSPENLSCDGELPYAAIAQKRRILERQLNGLCAAMGRPVSEHAAYEWLKAYEADEHRRKRA